jgi:hypothetical protein
VEDLDLEIDLEPEFDADPDRITKIKFDNYIDMDFVKTEPDLKNCQTDCTVDIPDLDFSNLMNSLVNLEEIYLDGCSHLDGSLFSQLIENPNLKKIKIIRRSTLLLN